MKSIRQADNFLYLEHHLPTRKIIPSPTFQTYFPGHKDDSQSCPSDQLPPPLNQTLHLTAVENYTGKAWGVDRMLKGQGPCYNHPLNVEENPSFQCELQTLQPRTQTTYVTTHGHSHSLRYKVIASIWTLMVA